MSSVLIRPIREIVLNPQQAVRWHMQIVGGGCALCKKRIGSELGVGACSSCKLIYHDDCLEKRHRNADRCPKCHQDFAETRAAQHELEQAALEKATERGRRRTHVAFAVVVLLSVIGTSIAVVQRQYCLGGGFLVAWFTPLYVLGRGSMNDAEIFTYESTRMLSVVGLLSGAAINGVFSYGYFKGDSFGLASLSVIGCAGYAGVAALLSLNSEVRHYLRAQDPPND